MGFWKKTPKEKAADHFTEAADRATEIAGTVAHNLADAASSALNWATPRVEQAAEKLAPVAQDAAARAQAAAHDAYDKARPYVDDAVAKARPYVEDAQSKVGEASVLVREDYLPRAKRAAAAALEEAKNGEGDLKSRAQAVAKVSKKELAKVEKKSKKGKVFGTLFLLAAAAGAAYVAWARSKPIEDPWAEAYWEDVAAPEADDAPVSVAPEAEEAPEAEDTIETPEEVIEEPESLAEQNAIHEIDGEEDVVAEVADTDEKTSAPTPLDVAPKFEDNEK